MVRSSRPPSTKRMTPISDNAAKKRLIVRHHRHDAHCVSTPPSNRPMAAPDPPTAPKMAKAFARSLGSRNANANAARAAGANSPPKTPWTAREVTSTAKVLAAPPTADARENPMSPTMRDVRRPHKSLRRPPRNIKEPKANAYAVMSHWRLAEEKFRSTCARGRAMLMTVASRATISCVRLTVTRPHHRRVCDVEVVSILMPLSLKSSRHCAQHQPPLRHHLALITGVTNATSMPKSTREEPCARLPPRRNRLSRRLARRGPY